MTSLLSRAPSVRAVFGPTAASFAVLVLAANGARTIANPLQYPSATNNQVLIIGGTNSLTFTGPYALNGQDGTTPATNRTLQVNNTGPTTISGVISDGGNNVITSSAATPIFAQGAVQACLWGQGKKEGLYSMTEVMADVLGFGAG